MKRAISTGILSLLLGVWPSVTHAEAPADDIAMQPAHVIVSPWKQHIPPTKRQGVAGIERTARGRLWVIYGRDVESTRNFQVVRSSDDNGTSWSNVRLMILPREGTRAMSANVWTDPLGRLWMFWGQCAGLQDGRYACGQRTGTTCKACQHRTLSVSSGVIVD